MEDNCAETCGKCGGDGGGGAITTTTIPTTTTTIPTTTTTIPTTTTTSTSGGGACADKDDRCPSWTEYCGISVWMKQNCAKTCGKCGGDGCQDKDPRCGTYPHDSNACVEAGPHEQDKLAWMDKNCAKLCSKYNLYNKYGAKYKDRCGGKTCGTCW